jgi:hypothetical protein
MKQPSTPVSLPAILMALILLFSACKGSSSETPQPSTQPTSAVVKLSAVGTLPTGTKIGAIDLVLTLAPGVTLKSTTNPPATDDGVVTASGVAINSLIVGNYSAPTTTLPGKVRIGIVSASGFATGEFATVNGDIAAGISPKASDFSVPNFTVTDNEPTVGSLTGLTAGLSVDIH